MSVKCIVLGFFNYLSVRFRFSKSFKMFKLCRTYLKYNIGNKYSINLKTRCQVDNSLLFTKVFNDSIDILRVEDSF